MADWAEGIRALGLEWEASWTGVGDDPDLMLFMNKVRGLVWDRWNTFSEEQKQEAFMRNEWDVYTFDPEFVRRTAACITMSAARRQIMNLMKVEEDVTKRPQVFQSIVTRLNNPNPVSSTFDVGVDVGGAAQQARDAPSRSAPNRRGGDNRSGDLQVTLHDTVGAF